MDYNIKDVSGRLKSTREYLDISVGEMANKTNVTTDEYISLENGEKDFSLSFLNQAADALGVELIELLTGVTPKLNTYSIVRKDQGLPIERRERFAYQHLAFIFLGKLVNYGCYVLAGAAPFGPKINHKGLARLDFLSCVIVIEFKCHDSVFV